MKEPAFPIHTAIPCSFFERLADALGPPEKNCCDGTLKKSRAIFFQDVKRYGISDLHARMLWNVWKSIFSLYGGFCDCEVMLNFFCNLDPDDLVEVEYPDDESVIGINKEV